MTAAQLGLQRLSGGGDSHAPEQVGRKIARQLFGTRVPRRKRDTLNQAMHWAYGTSWGIPFGLAGRPSFAGGLAFGLSVWGAGLAELPAFGVAPPPWEQSPGALASDAALHAVYGVAAAAALRVLP
jgi:ABC-type branched-subunit amino acid transport system permease subunit